MKAPKCRLCEHDHWSHEPHVFPAVAEPVTKCNQCTVKNADIERLRNQCAELQSEIERLRNQIAGRSQATKPKRDRAQYMRDWRNKRSTPVN